MLQLLSLSSVLQEPRAHEPQQGLPMPGTRTPLHSTRHNRKGVAAPDIEGGGVMWPGRVARRALIPSSGSEWAQ